MPRPSRRSLAFPIPLTYAPCAVLPPSPRSPWAAQQAAQLVDVEYGPPPSGEGANPVPDVPPVPNPILSVDDAIAAGSLTPIPGFFFPFPTRPGDSVGKGKSLVLEAGIAPAARPWGGPGAPGGGPGAPGGGPGAPGGGPGAPGGGPGAPGASSSSSPGQRPSVQGVLDSAGAPSAAQVALEGAEGGAGGGGASGAGEGPSPATGAGAVLVTGRYSTPSQQHVYMETQSAVAWPDEDGMVHVWSGTQSTDRIQVGLEPMQVGGGRGLPALSGAAAPVLGDQPASPYSWLGNDQAGQQGQAEIGPRTARRCVAYAVAWTKSQVSKQVLVEGEASGMSGNWKRTSRRLRL